MKKFTQHATTDGTGLFWNQPDQFFADLSEMKGDLQVDVSEVKNTISLQQLRGHWGVIIPQIIKVLENKNFEFPVGITKKKVAHYLMKARFLAVRNEEGHVVYLKEFTELDVNEVGEFWDKIVVYFGEKFGVEVRLPEKPTIKIIKIGEMDDLSTANPVGYEHTGIMHEYPKIGKGFEVGYGWWTTEVQEIISRDTFRTKNSIYKIEILDRK